MEGTSSRGWEDAITLTLFYLKLFLTSEEPLQLSSSPVRTASLLRSLELSRQSYVQQLQKYMKAPDGSYEEGFILPGSLVAQPERSVSKHTAANLETNNPLSLHNEVQSTDPSLHQCFANFSRTRGRHGSHLSN